MNFSCIKLAFLAPKSMSFEDISSTSLMVGVTAADANPAVSYFEALIKGSSPPINCTIKYMGPDLRCQLVGLNPSTLYTIFVKACLPGSSGCSRYIKDSVWTMPTGEKTLGSQ